MICVLLFGTTNSNAQYENVWAFGQKAGLDFNNGNPVPIETSIITPEACASVCDSTGLLLFYTEGSYAWDRNGNIMPNGSGLTPFPNNTATPTASSGQGTIIIPMPGHVGKYYIFSLTSRELGNNMGKLYYSIVDMDLNSGLGDITAMQKAMYLDSGLVTEGMTGVTGDNCNIWLAVISKSDSLKVFNITDAGIEHAVVSPIISEDSNSYDGGIYCKMDFSPDRHKLAIARRRLAIYDFDPFSGLISDILHLDDALNDPSIYYFSACFSPDNTKLYANPGYPFYTIFQFDLSSGIPTTIVNSKTAVSFFPANVMDIKRAPDGKIYGCTSGSANLNVINFPNLAGTDCQFVANAITLFPGTLSGDYMLPNVVPFFRQDTLISTQETPVSCFASSWALYANDPGGWEYHWNDSVSGSDRIVNHSGTYWVSYHKPPCDFHIDTFHVNFQSYLPQLDAEAGCKKASNAMAWVIPFPSDTVTYAFTWRDHAGLVLKGPVLSNQGDTLQNIVSGNYTLEVSAPDGCDTTLEITVFPPGYETSFYVSDSIVCMGDTVLFNNTSEGTFAAYRWNFDDGNNTTLENPEHAFQHAGNYRIQLAVQTLLPCYDTIYHTISVDSVLGGSFLMDRNRVCRGDAINFYPQTDSTALSLHWSFGDGTELTGPNENQLQHAYDTHGVLPVKLNTQFRACPDTSFTDTLIVYALPLVNLGPDSVLCLKGAPLFLENRASAPAGPFHNLWNTGDTTAALKVVHPGIYSLTLSTEPLGCSTTETVTVNKDCYIDIPNAFSPNGDGVNDFFFPRQLLSRSVTKFRMQIFNRWGQIIFESTSISGRGWDGTLHCKAQPAGVYLYLIDTEIDGQQQEHYQGNITLVK